MKKEDIEQLIDIFEKKDINKIRIKQGDFEIELEKQDAVSTPAAATNPAACTTQIIQAPQPAIAAPQAPVPASSTDTIDSPMVGTFYVAASPGAAPFIKAGQSVKKGDTIGIIEAMKIMNEIEAEFDCKIVRSLVEDGQPVEFAMPLYEVEKI
ncbi:acetyl-CoA carboxylase biotin carboxyl carrier protein [Campylobacter sp. 19-13652]|uniref:acetyl-CoA carboxylase biotin carboxyl carrier protein n=1 Tax=Campylobacter sp. 19-13652 TaxID=2840180 RepID=UPI001C760ADD|nr:acetyl-CoA carboxylase biotin carboxyl carrier protein [Campylobacter sp. 19-13652]BCX80140.1 acetyl-CoA carboxylase, biotin carboxyl carrier protein [Campylobacter sp. 19-13652]